MVRISFTVTSWGPASTQEECSLHGSPRAKNESHGTVVQTRKGADRAARAELLGTLTSSSIVCLPGAVCLLKPVSSRGYCYLCLCHLIEKGRVHSIITFPMMLPTSCRKNQERKMMSQNILGLRLQETVYLTRGGIKVFTVLGWNQDLVYTRQVLSTELHTCPKGELKLRLTRRV